MLMTSGFAKHVEESSSIRNRFSPPRKHSEYVQINQADTVFLSDSVMPPYIQPITIESSDQKATRMIRSLEESVTSPLIPQKTSYPMTSICQEISNEDVDALVVSRYEESIIKVCQKNKKIKNVITTAINGYRSTNDNEYLKRLSV
jgi:hypothetical protein